MSGYQKYIISNHKVMLGKPVIKGTRITVEFILKKLLEGVTVQQIATQYRLETSAIYVALCYKQ
ncbi:DUF433 domain-containing protein [Aquimarina sp. ERC-38]|uniref:DUF433 domain-containing protein n=1 Tax=Aquimarina sp. ERC-38 TaxID=2949996 RepID=UPI002245059E|nr:DUF433 domain-containing protein [Aquimarina sp. ERC-38]UZO82479.1 DUF433 domain-containing protein [Aquimarina sp. ERC-38]